MPPTRGWHLADLSKYTVYICQKAENGDPRLAAYEYCPTRAQRRQDREYERERELTRIQFYNNHIKLNSVLLVTVQGCSFRSLETGPFQGVIDYEMPVSAPNDTGIAMISIIHEKAGGIRDMITAEVHDRLICLKIDFATYQDRSFLGIHAQFIRDEKLIVRTLLLEEIDNDVTDKYWFLKDKLEFVIERFNIDKETIYCITDSGLNYRKLKKIDDNSYEILDIYADIPSNGQAELGDEFMEIQYDRLIEDIFGSCDTLKPRTMSSPFHVLRSAVEEMIESNGEVQALLVRVRESVRLLQKTNVMISSRKPPILDCPAIWQSTYHMLDHFKFIYEDTTDAEAKQILNLFTTATWQSIINLKNCLVFVYELSLKVQRHLMTFGDIFIDWLVCKHYLNKLKTQIAQFLLKCMEKRERIMRQNAVLLETLYMDIRLQVILSNREVAKAQQLLQDTLRKVQQIKGPKPGPIKVLVMEEPGSGYEASIDEMMSAMKQQKIREQNDRNANTLQSVRYLSKLDHNKKILKFWNKYKLSADQRDLAACVLAVPANQATAEKLLSSMEFICKSEDELSGGILDDILMIRNHKVLLVKTFSYLYQ